MATSNTQSNWSKFDKAFNQVSSFIILDSETKDVIAKIALKYPKDGAGRLSCYIHIIGTEVQIGTASGYGYDKRTASIINASQKISDLPNLEQLKLNQSQRDFITCLSSDKAQSGWQEVINEKNGFIVIQAI